MTLAKAKTGFCGSIANIAGPKVIVQRLIELGIVPGQKIHFIGSSLFGEPIIIEVKNTKVALRKIEAECIEL